VKFLVGKIKAYAILTAVAPPDHAIAGLANLNAALTFHVALFFEQGCESSGVHIGECSYNVRFSKVTSS
jgi:hypothetical protein